MKKTLSIAILVLFGATVFAQIEVGTNNNVAVGINGPVNSKLSVNHVGSPSWAAYISNPNIGHGLFGITIPPISNSAYGYGIYGRVEAGLGKTSGLVGVSYNSIPKSYGIACGVYGYAGNAKSGLNYGIKGLIYGSNDGAGIFGTSTNTNVDTGGKYAGYFFGAVKVTGDLWVGGTFDTSDKKAKKEIRNLGNGNIAKLKKVKAVKFKYKTPIEIGLITGEATDTITMGAEMTEYYNRDRIGLIAQEIQLVYPELVKEDQQGVLGINYTGLIPVLLEAIKEQQVAIENQQTTIEELAAEVEKLKKRR